MKRTVIVLSLIFALAIALSVSIPTLAADDSGTTVITGTLGGHIDITDNTSTLSFDALIPDQLVTTNGSASVSVKCNKAGWTLTVEEYGAGADQKMAITAGDIAENELQVRGGDISSWTDIGPAAELVESGAKYSDTSAVTVINDIQFGQTATYEDDAGEYTITVLFTASID